MSAEEDVAGVVKTAADEFKKLMDTLKKLFEYVQGTEKAAKAANVQKELLQAIVDLKEEIAALKEKPEGVTAEKVDGLAAKNEGILDSIQDTGVELDMPGFDDFDADSFDFDQGFDTEFDSMGPPGMDSGVFQSVDSMLDSTPMANGMPGGNPLDSLTDMNSPLPDSLPFGGGNDVLNSLPDSDSDLDLSMPPPPKLPGGGGPPLAGGGGPPLAGGMELPMGGGKGMPLPVPGGKGMPLPGGGGVPGIGGDGPPGLESPEDLLKAGRGVAGSWKSAVPKVGDSLGLSKGADGKWIRAAIGGHREGPQQDQKPDQKLAQGLGKGMGKKGFGA